MSNLSDPFLLPESNGDPVSRRDIVRLCVPPGGASIAEIERRVKIFLPGMGRRSLVAQLYQLRALREVQLTRASYSRICGPTTRPKPRKGPRRTI